MGIHREAAEAATGKGVGVHDIARIVIVAHADEVADAGGRLLYANAAAGKLLGPGAAAAGRAWSSADW